MHGNVYFDSRILVDLKGHFIELRKIPSRSQTLAMRKLSEP
jgi:hypothetical protein